MRTYRDIHHHYKGVVIEKRFISGGRLGTSRFWYVSSAVSGLHYRLKDVKALIDKAKGNA